MQTKKAGAITCWVLGSSLLLIGATVLITGQNEAFASVVGVTCNQPKSCADATKKTACSSRKCDTSQAECGCTTNSSKSGCICKK